MTSKTPFFQVRAARCEGFDQKASVALGAVSSIASPRSAARRRRRRAGEERRARQRCARRSLRHDAATASVERRNRELRQANEILRKASAVFCPGVELDRFRPQIAFIDDHRQAAWVEPISQGVADRPVDPRPCRKARRSPRLSARQGRCLRRRSGAGGELPGLRGPQGLRQQREGFDVAAARAPDEGHGPRRHHPRATHHGERQGAHALDHVNRQFHARLNMGLDHLRRDLDRLRLCRLCHRHHARRIVGWR